MLCVWYVDHAILDLKRYGSYEYLSWSNNLMSLIVRRLELLFLHKYILKIKKTMYAVMVCMGVWIFGNLTI